ncbi:hypothetical protein Tco_0266001 [Tanacetum coccineum]
MLGWGSWTNECEERGLESGSILAMKRRIDKVFYPSEAGMQLGGVRYVEFVDDEVKSLKRGENLVVETKGEKVCTEKVVKMPWSCKVRVGSNVTLLRGSAVMHVREERMVVMECCIDYLKKRGVRVAREDDRGVTEGREDVREVFQQHGSGAKRKLSRCGRNQMGNEPILALPKGADDFVVYYDARSKDLEACLEKSEKVIAYKMPQKKERVNKNVAWLGQRSVKRDGERFILVNKVTTVHWRDVRTLSILRWRIRPSILSNPGAIPIVLVLG